MSSLSNAQGMKCKKQNFNLVIMNGILANRYYIKPLLPLPIMKLKLSKINQMHNYVITVVEDVRDRLVEKLLQ